MATPSENETALQQREQKDHPHHINARDNEDQLRIRDDDEILQSDRTHGQESIHEDRETLQPDQMHEAETYETEETDQSEPDTPQPVTVSGYTFGEHVTSCVPVHYLSVFLKYFLPLDYVSDQCLKQVVESQFAENLFALKSGLHVGPRSDYVAYHVTGSKAEGLALPDYVIGRSMDVISADDAIQIVAYKNEYELGAETITDALENLTVEEETLDSSKKTKAAHKLSIISVIPQPDLPKNCCKVEIVGDFLSTHDVSYRDKTVSMLHAYLLNQTAHPINPQYSRSLQGLILSVIKNPDAHNSAPDDVNMGKPKSTTIKAIQMAGWPVVADNWTKRPRSSEWPSEECIRKILDDGYHLLPVDSGNGSETEAVWIYSFFAAEAILAQSMTKDQRKCFIVLKLLFDNFLDDQSVFTNYHLKTFFLWICEFIPAVDFRDTHFGATFLTILETLHDVLKKRDLNHYFIDEINLLSITPMEQLQPVAEKIHWLTENVIDCLFKVDERVTFIHALNNREKLSVTFASAFHSCKVTPKDEDAFVASIHDGLEDLLRCYVAMAKDTSALPDHCALEKKTNMNILTDLLREILVDLREFEDIDVTVHNMDFMLGALVSARKDPALLAQIYVRLCMRAGLTDKSKMAAVLEGVSGRACALYSLKGKAFVLKNMEKCVYEMNTPSDLEASNKAIYMQHYKDVLLSEMLAGISAGN